ncbi:ankyrin [Stigmatella aurantiaca DW4/3-1]|nr:ankyrin [Stigmatella aurantiaca DW4/3-1]
MLVSSARRGDAQRVRELLDAGVSPRSSTWSAGGSRLGSTTSAAEAAVDSEVWEAVEPFLVDAEAGKQALHRALQQSNLDLIQRLVQNGVKPEPSWAFDAYTRALQLSDRTRSEALVKRFVDMGLDPNATWIIPNPKEERPLVNFIVGQAAYRRKGGGSTAEGYSVSPWAAEVLLLHAKPRLDVQDNHGKTALMEAAQWGDGLLVNLLLEQGADPTLLDQNGLSAASYAYKRGHEALGAMLKDLPPPSSPKAKP